MILLIEPGQDKNMKGTNLICQFPTNSNIKKINNLPDQERHLLEITNTIDMQPDTTEA